MNKSELSIKTPLISSGNDAFKVILCSFKGTRGQKTIIRTSGRIIEIRLTWFNEVTENIIHDNDLADVILTYYEHVGKK